MHARDDAAPRAERAPQARAWRALHTACFWLAWSLIALFFVCGIALLIVRYVAMPRVDELRPRIEQIASRALKAPVKIGRIDASWRGVNPHLALNDVSIAGSDGQIGLSLPRVEGTLSWLSALALEPRFSSLRIEAPELDVARLDSKRFSVAGFVFDPDGAGGDSGASDWVLAQDEIVIRNARIRYRDQRPSAAATAFELAQVNLRLESLFGSHTLGVQAVPTATIAGPVDVRARFRHGAFARPSDHTRWTGEVFGEVDFADLAALARMFDAPIKVERAYGALRAWVTFDQARISRVVTDIALTDVNATLGDGLEPLKLASLQGRLSQRRWGTDDGSGGQEFEADRLLLVTAAKQTVAPLDIKVRTTRAKDAAKARTQVQTKRIDLQNLAWLTKHIPFARELRETVSKHAIEGTLTDVAFGWQGPKPEAKSLTLKTRFQGLASAAQPASPSERQSDPSSIGLPGFENLSGSIDVADGVGSMKLASKDAVLIVPGVFAEPRIKLAKLSASLRWTSDPTIEVRIESVAAANTDVEFEVSGTYRSANRAADSAITGPGWLDLTGRIAHLHAPSAFRYVPMVAGGTTLDWLQHALVAGRATDGRHSRQRKPGAVSVP